jgi:hypothetical protein
VVPQRNHVESPFTQLVNEFQLEWIQSR